MTQPRRTSFIQLRPAPEPEHASVAMAWEDICRDSTWQGRWVALDDCAYNDAGDSAYSGMIVAS